MNFYDLFHHLKEKTRLSNPGTVIIEFKYDVPFNCYCVFVTNYITSRRKCTQISAFDLENLSNDVERNRNIENILTDMIQYVMEDQL